MQVSTADRLLYRAYERESEHTGIPIGRLIARDEAVNVIAEARDAVDLTMVSGADVNPMFPNNSRSPDATGTPESETGMAAGYGMDALGTLREEDRLPVPDLADVNKRAAEAGISPASMMQRDETQRRIRMRVDKYACARRDRFKAQDELVDALVNEDAEHRRRTSRDGYLLLRNYR